MDDKPHQPPHLARRTLLKGVLSFAAALSLGSLGRTHITAAASPPDPLTNFVFGQLCVVVSSDSTDPKALYYAVLGWLNSNITSLVRTASPVTADPVDRELNPGSLRHYLPSPDDGVSSVQWLTPLNTSLDSWTVLDPPVGPGNVREALLFYGIGVIPVGDPPALVRRLVNAVNQSLRVSAGGATIVFHVDGATPNWYVVTASDETCGGPGGKSEAAPSGEWRISFLDSTLESDRGAAVSKAIAQGSSSVVVAIVDTCPDPAAVTSALSSFPKNRLLAEVAKTVSIGQEPSLSAAAATPLGPLAPILPNWYGAEQATGLSLDQFAMADHGLFVAGIVRDAAPAAEIHLVRALGDYGVGTLQGLVKVLAQLPPKLNPTGKKRLIVNLSLMVDIPASHKIVERWFPGLSGVPQGLRMQDALAALDTSIRAAIDTLTRQGVLVIAAAGNDALPGAAATRPLPRFPARLQNVLSVGATRSDGTAASYSNQATVPFQPAAAPFGPATKNGIAVLGGEATLCSGWSGPSPAPLRAPVPALPALFGPRFIDLTKPTDAVVGISSAQSVTLGRTKNPSAAAPTQSNTTGWVYWAGTSFATPMISAIAAALWELDPTLPPRGTALARSGVADIIQSFGQAQVSDLGCGWLQVKQS